MDDAVIFQLYLPEAAAAACAAQLRLLTQDPASSTPSPLLGIANFEAAVHLPDQLLALGSEGSGSDGITGVADDLAQLQHTFSQHFSLPCQTQLEANVRHRAFQAFLKAVVERRCQHVELWLKENMASFLEDAEALTVQVSDLLQRWS